MLLARLSRRRCDCGPAGFIEQDRWGGTFRKKAIDVLLQCRGKMAPRLCPGLIVARHPKNDLWPTGIFEDRLVPRPDRALVEDLRLQPQPRFHPQSLEKSLRDLLSDARRIDILS